ncbi:hypothetical protein EDD29_3501 [Actinocorallia herbida]|uniref:Uncharacterized protein n=1 Tax=Actinocorallia herbida TaxID=58109 RepID=A0A3N1CXD1_9ACTN|nr:hypothetical protein [Actinocorallia herbida]ROO85947.1 hypothetical protein EDD29_3501 [Actinocorallia herbida]
MQRAKVIFWCGAAIASTAAGALAVYLASVGWDEADKIAGVISLFVALIGLALAVWGAVASGSGGDLRVGGSLTDVGRTKGDVVIRRRDRGRRGPPGTGPAVAGDHDRVRRTKGSVRIEDQP